MKIRIQRSSFHHLESYHAVAKTLNLKSNHSTNAYTLMTDYKTNESSAYAISMTSRLKVEREPCNRKKQLQKAVRRLIDATLPQIGQKSHLLRFLWVIVYGILTLILAIMSFKMVQKYMSYPTSISVNIVYQSKLMFPGVTVCNENPLRKSVISRMQDYQDLYLLEKYSMNSVYAFSEQAFGLTQHRNCNDGFYKCNASGTCIPREWLCDGVDNCGDDSDENPTGESCIDIKEKREKNTTELQGTVCNWPFVQCPENTKFCASPCDQIVECQDNYDESLAVGCNVDTCTFTLSATDEAQILTSHRYPESYSPNADCFWTITAEVPDHKVLITILDLQIEGEPESCRDFVQFFDGENDQSETITITGLSQLCGYKIPTENSSISSSQNSISVLFKTNLLLNMRGFKLSYQAIVNEKEEKSSSGSSLPKHLSSPKYDYANSTNSTNKVQSNRSYSDRYSFYAVKNFNYIKPKNLFNLYKTSQKNRQSFRTLVKFPQEILKLNGQQKEDFIVDCMFNNVPCDASYFSTYQDYYYGNCFTFNALDGNNDSFPYDGRIDTKSGRSHGLKLTIFIDSDEYLGVLSPLVGARATIQDRKEYPHVRDFGIALGAGQTTFIAIQKEIVSNLGGKYSDCVTDWPDTLHLNERFKKQRPGYEQYSCLYFCFENEMARRCGCTDGFDFYFSQDDRINEASQYYCDPENATQRSCIKSVYSDSDQITRNCPCPSPCVEISYNQQESQAPYFSRQNSPDFVQRLLDSKSARLVSYITRLLNDSQLSEETLKESLQENFAKVEIFYQALSFEETKENVAYDFSDLLADFGGNLGLWLGWSVVLLFEIVQFFYESLEIVLRRPVKRYCTEN